jgi:hypothetical protein
VCIYLGTCRESRTDTQSPSEGFAQVRRNRPRLTSVLQAAIFCATLVAATVAQTPIVASDSCHDDLDKLRKASSEASEAAGDAKSKGDDLDDCRRHPETYDLMHDNCRSVDSDYQSALSDLEGKMEDVDTGVRSTQDSCGYHFTVNRLTSLEASQRRLEAAQQRFCTSYRRLAELGIPRDTALQMCKAQADEKWCKQCLGLR